MRFHLLIVLFTLIGSGCIRNENRLFRSLAPDETGVDFANDLTYTEELNPYTYKNFFNGGGVGIGDINNDGLSDLFFCGNMVSNRLYLNQGDLRFEDITRKAGLESLNVWSSGVSMADINGDGWLDIYVCKSGPPGGGQRHNSLYINNRDLTFTERASEFGLDHIGLSSHAAFFDYDKDGDLDCYLLNNSLRSVGGYDLIEGQRDKPDTLGGNKLYQNVDGFFEDVTLTAGIYSSDIGFGLGVTIGDIDSDGWPDIYVSNDFFERDYLYINQRDGTFEERLTDFIPELSMGSMGADMADINNDGNSELFVTEMLPEQHDRLMSKAIFESWDKHQLAVDRGYHYQFGRNVLQLNNGDGTFSEIGRYAGVEATDWSWGALIFDMDNDGWKDLFVANGIYKDLLDQDYISFMSDPGRVRDIIQTRSDPVKSMIDMMPSEPLANYAFRNVGNLTFEKMSLAWGFSDTTFSNGSAYGDLDNDGDLDLVVNNVNQSAGIYENRAIQLFEDRSYIGFELVGLGQNTAAIGSRVEVFTPVHDMVQELYPMRGFESTIDGKLLFGLGNAGTVDSAIIRWPDHRVTRLIGPKLNNLHTVYQEEANDVSVLDLKKNSGMPYFEVVEDRVPDHRHVENSYVDFDRERLLFHMNSTEGPCMCKGDVDGNGLEDFFVGGAAGQPGTVFMQQSDDRWIKQVTDFQSDRGGEDLDCVFFDANGDGFQDLYVASGGSEFTAISLELTDRLYFGNGFGRFQKSEQKLPVKGLEATSTVVNFDVDGDGDLDLFVGGRLIPGYYGFAADSYLLLNDGNGSYSKAPEEMVTGFPQMGMVTAADVGDLDGNGDLELVAVGKWMPLTIFELRGGIFENVTHEWGLEHTNGSYNAVTVTDLDGDGRPEVIAGNHGLNSRFHASVDEPLSMIINDFDGNGTVEQVTTMYFDGVEYPFVQLKDLSMQMPKVRKDFLRFNDYKIATFDEVFGKASGKLSRRLAIYDLSTKIYWNKDNGLVEAKLPPQAQFAPVYAIHVDDFDRDGNPDVLLGGNFLEAKPEVGAYRASYGTVLLSDGNGGFEYGKPEDTGLSIPGSVRGIIGMDRGQKRLLIVARNNESLIYATY